MPNKTQRLDETVKLPDLNKTSRILIGRPEEGTAWEPITPPDSNVVRIQLTEDGRINFKA